jgi:RNA polymerase sigma-70 factor (ECF subfamily)
VKLSDEHIKGLNEGNIQSFKDIHDEMYHSLCLYGLKTVEDVDAVKDCVQETFIVLWNKRADFYSILGTKAYLYTTVRNKLLNVIRDKKTIPLEDSHLEEGNADMQITKEETYKLLRDSIEKLPEQTRRIIKLAIEGHTNSEIAETLNISVNTIKTLKRRGFAALRDMLKDNIFALLLLFELLNN